MKSPESMGNIIGPTQIDIAENLSKIEEDTFAVEKEAERLGVSVEKYEEDHGKRKLKETHEEQINAATDFVEKWQREHPERKDYNEKDLSENIVITNNTSITISRSFVSYILSEAKKDMHADYYHQKYSSRIDDLKDVYMVEVKEAYGEKLQFEVYMNKGFFRTKKKFLIFKLDKDGVITFS